MSFSPVVTQLVVKLSHTPDTRPFQVTAGVVCPATVAVVSTTLLPLVIPFVLITAPKPPLVARKITLPLFTNAGTVEVKFTPLKYPFVGLEDTKLTPAV